MLIPIFLWGVFGFFVLIVGNVIFESFVRRTKKERAEKAKHGDGQSNRF